MAPSIGRQCGSYAAFIPPSRAQPAPAQIAYQGFKMLRTRSESFLNASRNRLGNQISHGQCRFWALLGRRVDLTSHASHESLSKRGRPARQKILPRAREAQTHRLGRAARFGERKLCRICWQTIFVSEIRQVADTLRICLVSRTFLTPTAPASPLVAASGGTSGDLPRILRLLSYYFYSSNRWTRRWGSSANWHNVKQRGY